MIDEGYSTNWNPDSQTLTVTIPMEMSLLAKAKKASQEAREKELMEFNSSDEWKMIQEQIMYFSGIGSYSCTLVISKIAQDALRREGFNVTFSGFSNKSTITWRE